MRKKINFTYNKTTLKNINIYTFPRLYKYELFKIQERFYLI